jgi:hypothetical protein
MPPERAQSKPRLVSGVWCLVSGVWGDVSRETFLEAMGVSALMPGKSQCHVGVISGSVVGGVLVDAGVFFRTLGGERKKLSAARAELSLQVLLLFEIGASAMDGLP